MDEEKFDDLEIQLRPMTDAETADQLYRYLVAVLDRDHQSQNAPADVPKTRRPHPWSTAD